MAGQQRAQHVVVSDVAVVPLAEGFDGLHGEVQAVQRRARLLAARVGPLEGGVGGGGAGIWGGGYTRWASSCTPLPKGL